MPKRRRSDTEGNMGAEYGRMREDERHRLEGIPESNQPEGNHPLHLEDPRDRDRMGRHTQPGDPRRREEDEAEFEEAGPPAAERRVRADASRK